VNDGITIETCSHCSSSRRMDGCAGHCTADLGGAVEEACWKGDERDLLDMLERVRAELNLGDCGPAYHAMVPAVILSTYRNCGGDVTRDLLRGAVDRGMRTQEGWCGLAGACGAGLGVGMVFSLLADVNPLAGQGRLNVMAVTTQVLRALCDGPDARCCLRETWLSLRSAADLSDQYLPITLTARGRVTCAGHLDAGECRRVGCPLRPNE